MRVSAVDCGSLPAVLNASTGTPVRTTYLCDVTFTCMPGHFFHRDVFDKTITCQADGVWTDIKSCVRTFHLLTIFILLKIYGEKDLPESQVSSSMKD